MAAILLPRPRRAAREPKWWYLGAVRETDEQRGQVYRGRCLCGDVAVELEGPLDFVAHCHCTSCRRAHAAAFVTWTSVPLARFELRGEHVRWYRSSETIEWGFCPRCGSSMLYRAVAAGHPEEPKIDRMYVAVAALVDPPDLAPAAHVSYEEHVPWFTPGDALPKHRGKTSERLDEPGSPSR